MAFEGNAGSGLNPVPASAQAALSTNYLDLASETGKGWAQQYVPDLMEKEAEVFGPRTVSGFLEKVGAEEAMAADQVVWSEQGRLHLAYNGTAVHGTNGQINITTDIDGNAIAASGEAGHGIRVGDTVVISTAAKTIKAYVHVATSTPGTSCIIKVAPYKAAELNTALGISANTVCKVFVYGSEYIKGSNGRTQANEPTFKSYNNRPIIMKDMYQVNGSDVSQIGWVEVTGEDGQSGFMWYLKAAGDTRSRFADYCEMAMLEAEKKSGATALDDLGTAGDPDLKGTEGLFAAVEDRGNVMYGVLDIEQFDYILKEFDKQGAIEEYMMYLDRTSALAIDAVLAGISAGSAGGTAYGLFNNDADMALNLGFSGFRRGSYDFYKTDWRYLNDKATRGVVGSIDTASGSAGTTQGAIKGMFIPAGTSTVYDQNLGKNLRRPFLHVRYRAGGIEDRRFKTWTTGSVGAVTSDLDAMEMHFLTERCLVVQGANNFMTIQG